MKKFETPEIEVTTFTVEDIITESQGGEGSNPIDITSCTEEVSPF